MNNLDLQRFALLLSAVLAGLSVQADDFPVYDVAGLTAALQEAESNDQDDTIVVHGDSYYIITETLEYVPSLSSDERHDLHIRGQPGAVGEPNLDGGLITRVLLIDTGGVEPDTDVEILVEGLVIRNGQATLGGGLYLTGDGATLRVRNCKFYGNRAGDEGGGLRIHSLGPVELANNQFQWNSVSATGASAAGASIIIYHDTADVVNNTFWWNEGDALVDDLRIRVDTGGTCNLYNNIFWSPASAPNDLHGFTFSGGVLNVYHNHWGSVSLDGPGTTNQGDNQEGDPGLAVNSHLLPGSGCIDTGSNAAPSMPAFDLDGLPRPNPNTGMVDIGAHEYYGSTATPTAETPTPAWTPTPTRTPTPPGAPTQPLGVRLDMPEEVSPGDGFWITGLLGNPHALMEEVPTFFVLEAMGEFWFWPGWVRYAPPESTAFDYDLVTLPSGGTSLVVIPWLTWPDTGGDAMDGLMMYGAMTDPEMDAILGELATRAWRFGPA